MNVKDVEFKTLTRKWTKNTSKQYLYVNKNLNENGYGIDYEHFIQLRFQSINENHIANIYKIEGWYLLWHLMCQSQSNQCMFLETTINTIYEKIDKKITSDNIKKYLTDFNKQGIIKLNKVRGINVNTPLQIFISYGSNEYYPFQDSSKKWIGYKALPVDFVKTALEYLSPEEWSVFSVMCVRYRYWQTKVESDNYGNTYYNLYKEHYAFPTMEDIGGHIGRGKSQVSVYVDKLASNPLELIKVFEPIQNEMRSLYDEEGKFIGNKRKNYIYYIHLFERVEWIYQNIIKQDTRDEKTKKKNIKNFNEIATSGDYYTLKDTDYLMAHFGNDIKQYKKALEENDIELYKSCEKRCEHENGITNLPESSADKVVEIDFSKKTG